MCRYLVESARERELEVIDRCNLTVLLEPGQEHLAQYLAQHQVWPMLSLTTCICSPTCTAVALLILVVKFLHPHSSPRAQTTVELLLCGVAHIRADCSSCFCSADKQNWKPCMSMLHMHNNSSRILNKMTF